jgi:hypothetical protein
MYAIVCGLIHEASKARSKAAARAEKQRFAPAHKQDATDEHGRKRFHGAFTGGFSAGYFNTVGSKEGQASKETLNDWRLGAAGVQVVANCAGGREGDSA